MLLWLSPFLVVCLLLACWFRAAGKAGAAQLRASAFFCVFKVRGRELNPGFPRDGQNY